MRYYVTLDPGPESKAVVVDVQRLPNGSLLVQADGKRVDVDDATVGRQLSVLVDGRVVDLTIDGSQPDIDATASGQRVHVRVVAERPRTGDTAGRDPHSSAEKVATSPMPGRVVKVLVRKGDSVLPGQPLVVMEAMKMENEIRAKASGTVAEVHVLPGAAVDSNKKLVTLA